jgi:hypothetical protein
MFRVQNGDCKRAEISVLAEGNYNVWSDHFLNITRDFSVFINLVHQPSSCPKPHFLSISLNSTIVCLIHVVFLRKTSLLITALILSNNRLGGTSELNVKREDRFPSL